MPIFKDTLDKEAQVRIWQNGNKMSVFSCSGGLQQKKREIELGEAFYASVSPSQSCTLI